MNCNPLTLKEYDNAPDKYQYGQLSVLVVKDKGQHHYRIDNRSRNYLVKLRLNEVNQTRRCDYLILDCSFQNVYFVELKGQNLSDAFSQIETTIESFSPRFQNYKFYCRVVQTKVIAATQQGDKERLIKYLKTKHKANLQGSVTDLIKIGSQKLIEVI
ncbi:MAG TPA: hypothetical protein VGN64_04685 [Dyadobacter sp.]|jgi:hypothetical protein|nr:hypothetical protein [Dyadobacter sp.]